MRERTGNILGPTLGTFEVPLDNSVHRPGSFMWAFEKSIGVRVLLAISAAQTGALLQMALS